jgi:hypothetical protein
MTFMRNLLLMGTAVAGLTLLVAAPASARTLCREDGYCYNTSGDPVYQQPQWGRSYHEGYYRKHRHYHED